MNATEKEFIQRGWDEMSNESIVKDVATKGKYINLAIGFLSKRLDTPTVQEAKNFFRIEVNKYVERLLSNKQVFKAEHVLSNVNINPKFYFYEFYENCDNSEVRCAIINYLKKTLGDDYEQEHLKITVELKALKIVKADETLREKYVNVSTLEDFHAIEVRVQNELLTDVCFGHKCEFIIVNLDKHVTWKYLLDHQLFVFLSKWIEPLDNTGDKLIGLDSTFENLLQNQFASWKIDEDMISQLKQQETILPDFVLNGLAKKSIFMKYEESDIDLLLKRIISSESMNEHREMVLSRPHSLEIIKNILDRDLIRFLIEDFVSVNDLADVASQYPNYQDEIELCIDLKEALPSDIATISSKITQYLMKRDQNFQNNHPLVKLVEIFLQENATISMTPSSNDYKEIPLLKTILQKFESTNGLNDFDVILQDLVKRFEMVDLRSIKSDAGDEDFNFSNSSLFEV